MKTLITPALASIAALFIGACAATNTTAPSTPPSATVKIQEWSAAYDVSAAAGKGILTFNGQDYPFTITGLGAGGTGVQKMSATGKVYNMNSLSDFPGTYQGISKGLTLIEGRLHAKLTNGNGVVMYIAGETEGLASATGVREFMVTLKN
jgi:hypothetical protein